MDLDGRTFRAIHPVQLNFKGKRGRGKLILKTGDKISGEKLMTMNKTPEGLEFILKTHFEEMYGEKPLELSRSDEVNERDEKIEEEDFLDEE